MLTAIKAFMGLVIIAAMVADFVSSRRARRDTSKHEVEKEIVFDPDMWEMFRVAEITAIQCGVKDPCLIVGKEAYRRLQCSWQFRPPMVRIVGGSMVDMIPSFGGMHVYREENEDPDVVYAKSEADYIAGKQIRGN